MNIARALCSTWVALAALSANAAPVVRIDGSSPDRFERSHAELVASLSPQQRLRLSLAEIVYLESRQCLGRRQAHADSFVEHQLGGQVDLAPCRKALHGLGYREIMERSYPPGGGPGPEAVPPNSAAKSKPLRGAGQFWR
ncbi:hypothetical protein RAB70_06220 [Xanthomonas sontii]|uniref:hypothetical protein n=1 Tax=Xanthomonas sontii TaxID=2650745 RepID=UPI0011E65BD2|nr:hypothetical protein [Xanthomonas sontii]MDQ7758729.1 hypothetical protein [Xanthomonas sontii]UZK05795.1 hypothetical protein CJ027_002990 [Xanthomonas sontii]